VGQQVLEGFADLQELVQAGGLGDEAGDSDLLEDGLVTAGAGRAPDADGNALEETGASNFAQDLFAGVLGQVQVDEDQVGRDRIGVAALTANESYGLGSGGEVEQVEAEILILERPIEKEDIRSVIFDYYDAGGGNEWNVFQTGSQRPTLRCRTL